MKAVATRQAGQRVRFWTLLKTGFVFGSAQRRGRPYGYCFESRRSSCCIWSLAAQAGRVPEPPGLAQARDDIVAFSLTLLTSFRTLAHKLH